MAVERMKEALIMAPILVRPDFSVYAPTFNVWCDASHRAFRAVLLQRGKAIAFEGRA